MRSNQIDIGLGIFTAIAAVIVFIVCAITTGGYSNWLPYVVALATITPYWVWSERSYRKNKKNFRYSYGDWPIISICT